MEQCLNKSADALNVAWDDWKKQYPRSPFYEKLFNIILKSTLTLHCLRTVCVSHLRNAWYMSHHAIFFM
jgi:hypothetical protein